MYGQLASRICREFWRKRSGDPIIPERGRWGFWYSVARDPITDIRAGVAAAVFVLCRTNFSRVLCLLATSIRTMRRRNRACQASWHRVFAFLIVIS